MENIKKVSEKDFIKAVKKTKYENINKINWNGIDLNIKKLLSLQEVFDFVNNVVGTCIDEESGGGYLSELKDFAIKMYVLEMYGNIELPADASERYELIYSCDIFEKILEQINMMQFDEIISAIDKKINYILKANIKSVNTKIEDLNSSIEDFDGQMKNLFNDVSSENINSFMKTFASLEDGKVDEEKLVNALIKSGII